VLNDLLQANIGDISERTVSLGDIFLTEDIANTDA
jgi:hypothetical protein